MHEHGTVHRKLAEPDRQGRAFAVAIVLNSLYVLTEAGAGFAADSLALLSDAGHNLSDVSTLALAWAASRLTNIEPTSRRTYGWRSSSIMAALVNALLIVLAMGAVGWEAVHRLGSPAEVSAPTVIWVAAVGVVVNTATTLLFLRRRKEDLNVKAAYLHMAADAAVSAGVVVGGALILWTGWSWIDPVVTLGIVVVVLVGSGSLLRESANMALHAVPEGIDPEDVRAYLESLPGAGEVHDLHIWAISTTETALSAHLVRPRLENEDGDHEDALLRSAQIELERRFGIGHTTIQIEHGRRDCPQAKPSTV